MTTDSEMTSYFCSHLYNFLSNYKKKNLQRPFDVQQNKNAASAWRKNIKITVK